MIASIVSLRLVNQHSFVNNVLLPERSLTPELVGRLFSLFKIHCTEVGEKPGEFLRKWRQNIEISEGNCSFRARTDSFQSWFARVQRIVSFFVHLRLRIYS